MSADAVAAGVQQLQLDAPASAVPASSSASAAPASSAGADVWEDITSLLPSAARSVLRSGQLLHHGSFSLKESMSALELGDPKMDCGCLVPRSVLRIDRAEQEGLIVPGEELSLFQQLEIIDELLACEVSCHSQGGSVVHTLYTCLYLHRMKLIWPEGDKDWMPESGDAAVAASSSSSSAAPSSSAAAAAAPAAAPAAPAPAAARKGCPLLCAYICLTLKSIELIRAVISSADLFSEEDFYYSLHGLRIGSMHIGQNFRNAHSTATAAPSRPAEEGDKDAIDAARTAAKLEEEPLYGGLSIQQLLARFNEQHELIRTKVAELTAEAQAAAGSSSSSAAAAAAPSPADPSLLGPASADSSPLHLSTLLLQRFDFRSGWYHTHVLLQSPPFLLGPNLALVRPHTKRMARAIQGMLRSTRGSSEREEEAKRKAKEDAYDRECAEILRSHAEALARDPLAPTPLFPRKPSANLPPRELSWGFSSAITSCLVQSSPPKHASILHRRDALHVLQDFLANLSVLRSLPPSATRGGDLIQVLDFLEEWATGARAGGGSGLLLRSHLWLMLQNAVTTGSGGGGEAGGGGTVADHATDLFASLQAGESDSSFRALASPLAPAHAGSNQKKAPSPLDGHYNTVELTIRAHVHLSGSIESMALLALREEAFLREYPLKRPVLDPTTAPMDYAFFLSRMTVPLLNLTRVYMEGCSAVRKKLLHEGSTIVPDWNILLADAQAVDRQFWAPHALHWEELVVALPPGMHPQTRGNHPQLLYHHSCYSLLLRFLAGFQIRYILAGLSDSLYSERETHVVLWYLEHVLSLWVQNEGACYRKREELLVLKAKVPKDSIAAAGTGGAAHPAPPPLVGPKNKLPLQMPPPPLSVPPFSLRAALIEGCQFLCRGLIQLREGIVRMRLPPAAASAASNAVHTDASANGTSNSASSIDRVQVPTMDADLLPLWFAHRFADLHMLHLPVPLTLRDFQATMAQFDQAASSASAAKGGPTAAGGNDAAVEYIMSMAGRSLAIAKETFSKASQAVKAQQVAEAAAAHDGEDDGLDPAPTLHGDYIKSLLLVCVSNAMLPLTYKKTLATAAAAGKRVRLAMRWEAQAGAAYTPLHAAKLTPFPIFQLQQM